MSEKKLAYICFECGLSLDAPEGLKIECPKCQFPLEALPTGAKGFRAALAKAFDKTRTLQDLNDRLVARIEKLETQLKHAGLEPVSNDTKVPF